MASRNHGLHRWATAAALKAARSSADHCSTDEPHHGLTTESSRTIDD